MDNARANGTPESYDLNYRESLWKAIGGKNKTQGANRELLRKVDLLIEHNEDFTAMFGAKIRGVNENYAELPKLHRIRLDTPWRFSVILLCHIFSSARELLRPRPRKAWGQLICDETE